MKRLLDSLRPHAICSSVEAIDYEGLWRAGYRALIFDIDNTLGEWGCEAIPERVHALLRRLDASGFVLGFLSNDGGKNRPVLKEQLSCWAVVWRAKKPRTRGYEHILNLLRSVNAQTVMIGDQLFTDIWGAKRAGLSAILVAPVSPASDSVWARLRRPLERFLLKLFSGENLAHNHTDDGQEEYRENPPPHGTQN